jgi:hypothetical protein
MRRTEELRRLGKRKAARTGLLGLEKELVEN